jgi:putative flippase GtrA
MISLATLNQFFRYTFVGLLSNTALYLAYLGLTAMGLEPKIAMTTLYAIGLAQTFILNKRWSFRHEGMHGPAFIRYCLTYGIGYLINLLALLTLVDRLGYPHQIVQAALVVTVAIILFLLQKFWVFRVSDSAQPSDFVNQ